MSESSNAVSDQVLQVHSSSAPSDKRYRSKEKQTHIESLETAGIFQPTSRLQTMDSSRTLIDGDFSGNCFAETKHENIAPQSKELDMLYYCLERVCHPLWCHENHSIPQIRSRSQNDEIHHLIKSFFPSSPNEKHFRFSHLTNISLSKPISYCFSRISILRINQHPKQFTVIWSLGIWIFWGFRSTMEILKL